MKTPDFQKEDTAPEGFIIRPELFGTRSFYPLLQDITNEKDFSKFVKKCERMVRMSDEYSRYIRYLKSETGLNECFFLPNISTEDVKIELHHYPLTLFDITWVVSMKIIQNDEMVSTLMIANNVIKEHYQNNIGLVALDKTNHELAHNGQLVIPPKYVYGDVHSFLQKYLNYIPSDLLRQIEEVLLIDEIEAMEHNRKVLEFKPLLLNAIECSADHMRKLLE